jgi:hypothetical protein
VGVRCLGDWRPGGGKDSRCLRTFQPDRRQAARHVFQAHVVSDDVPVDVIVKLRGEFRFGVEQEVAGQAEDVCVTEDASLCVQKEGVASPARRELLDVIRTQGMEQASPVFAAHGNLSAPREI